MLNLYSERFASITRGYHLTAILEWLLAQLPATCRSLSTLCRRDRRVSSGRFVFRQRPVAVLQGIRVGNLTSSLLPCDRYYRSRINSKIAKLSVCFEVSQLKCIIRLLTMHYKIRTVLLAFDQIGWSNKLGIVNCYKIIWTSMSPGSKKARFIRSIWQDFLWHDRTYLRNEAREFYARISPFIARLHLPLPVRSE